MIKLKALSFLIICYYIYILYGKEVLQMTVKGIEQIVIAHLN